MEPVPVDHGRWDDAYGDPGGAADDRGEKRLALGARELLRVVQAREGANAVVAQALVVEENARDDERTREAAMTGLVRTREKPNPEAPVEAEELPARASHRRRIAPSAAVSSSCSTSNPIPYVIRILGR